MAEFGFNLNSNAYRFLIYVFCHWFVIWNNLNDYNSLFRVLCWLENVNLLWENTPAFMKILMILAEQISRCSEITRFKM